jgi:hypothetical protein
MKGTISRKKAEIVCSEDSLTGGCRLMRAEVGMGLQAWLKKQSILGNYLWYQTKHEPSRQGYFCVDGDQD